MIFHDASLIDRIIWFTAGGFLGFLLGWTVRKIQEASNHISRMETKIDMIKSDLNDNKNNERGIMRYPIVADFLLLLVIGIVVYSAFVSQQASNEVVKTQDKVQLSANCTQEFLGKTIRALNERTTYATDQAASNIELQKAQSYFIEVLLKKPAASQGEVESSLRNYFDTLTKFVKVNGQAIGKAESYPYPTTDELRSCLSGETAPQTPAP